MLSRLVNDIVHYLKNECYGLEMFEKLLLNIVKK